MIELLANEEIKTIAFYLPQFHTIPENDKAHGEGFTEWTNVRKAKPLFENHNQPRTPLNGNYYCLLDDGVMEKQAKMAKDNGIFGFCYYHYWFGNGEKLLEKPIENMLNNKNIDIPFCLCWANENWTKRWDGGQNEIIKQQDYSKEYWGKHLEYLVRFFKDERYISVNGSPILIVYKPEEMPNYKSWVKFMKQHIKDYGFKSLCIVVQYPTYYIEKLNRKVFDYYIKFEPIYTIVEEGIKQRSILKSIAYSIINKLPMRNSLINALSKVRKNRKKELTIRDYDDDWKRIIERKDKNEGVFLGAFVDWDNTPRNKNGLCYKNASPEKFGKYYNELKGKVEKENKMRCIFVNAWNEWAEGAYLEPDTRNGYKYLEAINKNIK